MIQRLAMSARHYRGLRENLLRSDGKEAAAIILCHRGKTSDSCILVSHCVIPIRDVATIDRTEVRVSWDCNRIFTPAFVENFDKNLYSLVTVHSHPSGMRSFSAVDDYNDRRLFPSVYGWHDDKREHASAVMLPDGKMFGRYVDEEGNFSDIDCICVADHKLKFWHSKDINENSQIEGECQGQIFSVGTYSIMKHLRIGVVGCSGTGSIIVEMLARNRVGEIVLVDDDKVETANLNRILNSKSGDVHNKTPKTTMLKKAIATFGLGTKVVCVNERTDSFFAREILKSCDVIFGCIDSAEGRFHLEALSTAYLIPYFDIGVRIDLDQDEDVTHAIAAAHYVCPGEMGLRARGVYTAKQVASEGLHRKQPTLYMDQKKRGYLGVVEVHQPAVISLNMLAASLSFNDFLARIHYFRLDDDSQFAVQRINLVTGQYEHESCDDEAEQLFLRDLGTGDTNQLLINV